MNQEFIYHVMNEDREVLYETNDKQEAENMFCCFCGFHGKPVLLVNSKTLEIFYCKETAYQKILKNRK